MRKTLTGIVLLCMPLVLPGQKISGSIKNAKTGEPIPFVHLVNVVENKGTFTNELGEFSINYANLPVRLIISHVAYNTKSIDVESDAQPMKIRLDESKVQLANVVVSAVSPGSLVHEAWKKNKAKKNQRYFGKAFYRQITQINQEPVEVQESFYDIIYNNQGFHRWQLTNGRYALKDYMDEEKTELTPKYKNYSSLTKMIGIYHDGSMLFKLPAGKAYKRIYDFELEETRVIGSDTLMIIQCTPKEKYLKDRVFGGLLTIRKNDLALLNFKGRMYDPFLRNEKKHRRYIDLDHEYYSVEIDYTVNHGLSPVQLNFIRVTNRFKHRKKGEDKWLDMQIESKLYFYEHNQIVEWKIAKKPAGYLLKDDRKLISELTYDPLFWEQNAIVKRTPLEEAIIKAFDDGKAFVGEMFRYR